MGTNPKPTTSLAKWGGATIRRQRVGRYRYGKGEWGSSSSSISEAPSGGPESSGIPWEVTLISWNVALNRGEPSRDEHTLYGRNGGKGNFTEGTYCMSDISLEESARTIVVTIRKHLRGHRKSSAIISSPPPAQHSTRSPTSPPPSPTSSCSSPSSSSSHASLSPPNQVIIHLQQVHHALFLSLLQHPWLRDNFTVVPSPQSADTISPHSPNQRIPGPFTNLWPSTGSSPFANITFVSRSLTISQATSLVFHNTSVRRHALVVDLALPTHTIPPSKDPNPAPSTRKTSLPQLPPRIIRFINAHLEPHVFDRTARENQVFLVKGRLSEVGIYAAVGTASTQPLSEHYLSKPSPVHSSTSNAPQASAQHLSTIPEGSKVDALQPDAGSDSDSEEREEAALARKLWARGPVQLENPHEIPLRGAVGRGLGIGFVHQIRVT